MFLVFNSVIMTIFRTQGSTCKDNDIESVEVQVVTEPIAVEEVQQDGYRSTEQLPRRKNRFRWLTQWAQRDPSTPQSIHNFICPGQQSGGYTVFSPRCLRLQIISRLTT